MMMEDQASMTTDIWRAWSSGLEHRCGGR